MNSAGRIQHLADYKVTADVGCMVEWVSTGFPQMGMELDFGAVSWDGVAVWVEAVLGCAGECLDEGLADFGNVRENLHPNGEKAAS